MHNIMWFFENWVILNLLQIESTNCSIYTLAVFKLVLKTKKLTQAYASSTNWTYIVRFRNGNFVVYQILHIRQGIWFSFDLRVAFCSRCWVTFWSVVPFVQYVLKAFNTLDQIWNCSSQVHKLLRKVPLRHWHSEQNYGSTEHMHKFQCTGLPHWCFFKVYNPQIWRIIY